MLKSANTIPFVVSSRRSVKVTRQVPGSGSVIWNPGTVSSGTIATLVYMVDVTPVTPGDLPATGVYDTGAGTRATYVDGTGNTTQARATHTLGELCGLVVDADTPTPAVIASFQSRPSAQGSLLEWRTAAEAGTVAFTSPQGNSYAVLDVATGKVVARRESREVCGVAPDGPAFMTTTGAGLIDLADGSERTAKNYVFDNHVLRMT